MNDGLNDCPLQSWTRLNAGATFGLQYCFIDSQNRTNKQVSTTALDDSSRFHRQYLNSHKASIFNNQIFGWKHPSQAITLITSSCNSPKAYTLSEDKIYWQPCKSRILLLFLRSTSKSNTDPKYNNQLLNVHRQVAKKLQILSKYKNFLMGHEQIAKRNEHPWSRSHNVALRNRKNIKRPSHT